MGRIDRRYAMVLGALALAAGAWATTEAPRFKNPAVQQAREEYEAAKRGYVIALERGINVATREKDQAEAERLQAELNALNTNQKPEPQSARDLARALANTRYDVASGIITFGADGSLSHTHRSWGGKKGTWKVIDSNEVSITTFDGRKWTAAFTRDREYLLLVLEPGRKPEGGMLRH